MVAFSRPFPDAPESLACVDNPHVNVVRSCRDEVVSSCRAVTSESGGEPTLPGMSNGQTTRLPAKNLDRGYSRQLLSSAEM